MEWGRVGVLTSACLERGEEPRREERNCGDKKGQLVYNLQTNPPDLENSLARFSFFDPFSFNLEQFTSVVPSTLPPHSSLFTAPVDTQ